MSGERMQKPLRQISVSSASTPRVVETAAAEAKEPWRPWPEPSLLRSSRTPTHRVAPPPILNRYSRRLCLKSTVDFPRALIMRNRSQALRTCAKAVLQPVKSKTRGFNTSPLLSPCRYRGEALKLLDEK